MFSQTQRFHQCLIILFYCSVVLQDRQRDLEDNIAVERDSAVSDIIALRERIKDIEDVKKVAAMDIGVARIFSWGELKFNKSYLTAGTDPENFSGRNADLN